MRPFKTVFVVIPGAAYFVGSDGPGGDSVVSGGVSGAGELPFPLRGLHGAPSE